jgi:hypothetical protein
MFWVNFQLFSNQPGSIHIYMSENPKCLTYMRHLGFSEKPARLSIQYLHTSYLSHSLHVRHVEKNLSCGEISDFYTWQMGRNLINVAEFRISPHDRCGELWNLDNCGEIYYFSTWQM